MKSPEGKVGILRNPEDNRSEQTIEQQKQYLRDTVARLEEVSRVKRSRSEYLQSDADIASKRKEIEMLKQEIKEINHEVGHPPRGFKKESNPDKEVAEREERIYAAENEIKAILDGREAHKKPSEEATESTKIETPENLVVPPPLPPVPPEVAPITKSTPETPAEIPTNSPEAGSTVAATPKSVAAREKAPAKKGVPEWRKLGKNDERLNEKKPEKPGEGLGRNRTLEAQSGDVTKKQAEIAEQIKNQKEHDSLVAERREARSEKFAEKFGLTELRNAKIAAEKAAYEEDLKHHKNPLRRILVANRDKREGARRKADEATLAWNKALANLPEEATDREKLEALIIRKRDTLIGPNAMRTQARIDALDARGKTLLGKVLNTPGYLATKALQGMAKVSGGIGKGLFNVVNIFNDKKTKAENWERQQAVYRRAGQIVTGAAIGSVMGIIAGPGGLAAAAGVIGFSTLRATLGTAVGTGAGYAAKGLHSATFGKSTKEDYRKEVRNTDVGSVHDLQVQQRSEKHGSRENRKKREQGIGIAAAVIGGGITSFELGHFAHLPSVQHALHEHPPVSPKVPMEKLQMEIGGTNAENVNLYDSDRLFGHFGLMLQRDFAHVPHAHTPAIDTYNKLLETHAGKGVDLHHGEDHMARAFGFEGQKGLSEVMHKGDTVMLDTDGRVLITWADGRPFHVLINTDGSINHNIDDITAHMKMPHHVGAEHAAASGGADAAANTPATEASSAVDSENLGAAPMSPYTGLAEAVERARDVSDHNAILTQFQNLKDQHDTLLTQTNNPNYQHLIDQYNKDLLSYKQSTDAYLVSHPSSHAAASVRTETAPVHEATTSEITAPSVETTTNGFHLNTDHGYEVGDSAVGESGLVFYGPHDANFMTKLQEFARQHPGKPIQFDSPEPTTINGTPQSWVATASYSSEQGFVVEALPTDPTRAGTALDPSVFKREIY